MRPRRRYYNSTSFLDLLFNNLLVFVVLFMMAFMLVAPKKKDANIESKAEFVITLNWDDLSNDDVDIWVEDPMGGLVWFRETNNGITHLDRDDVGIRNDSYVTPNGERIEIKQNQEIVSIRGFLEGEWVINVHMYKKRSDFTANVEVKMDKLNPSVKTIFVKKIKMPKNGQEITIARIQMTKNGEILSVADGPPKKLVKLTEALNVH